MPAAQTIADAFVSACLCELKALKPGNVHVHSAGHGMEVAQFEAAARAAAPHIADPTLTIGRRVRSGVAASWAAAGCNTNLGILLLCAPLARAAERVAPAGTLRMALASELRQLSRDDAVDAFQAIALANPAGLGSVPDADVHTTPEVSLLEAMRLASPRDRIALAYVTDFADVFEFALPALNAAQELADDPWLAISTLHMALLATFVDSHILRKHGELVARRVKEEAASLTSLWRPVVRPQFIAGLLQFDRQLKDRGINPGTTADFVVATLFADSLCRDLQTT